MKTDLLYLLNAPPPTNGENADAAVRRIFRGDTIPCRRCGGTMIEWKGICDACGKALCLAAVPPSVDEVLRDRGVPQALLHASFETFDTKVLPKHLLVGLGLVRRWRPSKGPPFLLLEGPTGVGKSHLAVAILRGFVETGRRGCRFVAVPQLLERLKTGYGSDATDNEVDALDRVELLVLDDLGAARLTDWSVDVQSSILTSRYNAGRGTIITTNMSLSEISERIDPRVASRLGEALNLRMDLPDYRARRVS